VCRRASAQFSLADPERDVPADESKQKLRYLWGELWADLGTRFRSGCPCRADAERRACVLCRDVSLQDARVLGDDRAADGVLLDAHLHPLLWPGMHAAGCTCA
jgi:hypothetical protein